MCAPPVLSVWPTMTTWVPGLRRRLSVKLLSTGRNWLLMVALLLSNEMSLGMASCSWLSAVRDTVTPVPRVAASSSWRWRSMLADQM